MRICKKCGTEQPLEAFVKRSTYCADCRRAYRQEYRANNREAAVRAKKKWEAAHPEEVREGKRRRYHANLEKSREQQRQWRKDNPETVAERNRLRRERAREHGWYDFYRHGITKEQKKELFDRQRGLCAICDRPLTVEGKNMNIDHCHTNSYVRGLLCARCNPSLGWYESHMERISTYLAAGPAQLTPAHRPKRQWTPPRFD